MARRIVPDFEAARAFYTGVLGLHEGDHVGFADGQAQVVLAQPGVPQADMGIEPGAGEAAHAEAVERSHEILYGPVDEPWGVPRVFVRDPTGTVVSVLAHR